jgi:hypothetical protein
VYPARGRAVAVALVGIVLLAIAFTIAASAQETTTGTGTNDTGQQAQEQQSQEQQSQEQQSQEQQSQEQQSQEAQPGATTLMQSEPAAQSTDEVAARPLDGQIVAQSEDTYAASEALIGQPVISAEGEDMGTIADLLVTEDNRIAGVMIGIGGFLGFGEQRIAIEIDQLAREPLPEGGERLSLNYTRAELEQAPEFVSLTEQLRQQEAEQARQELGAGTQEPPAASQPLKQ